MIKINRSTTLPRLKEIDINDSELFPKVHQFLTDPKSFCIYSRLFIGVLNFFEYKGVTYKIVQVKRQEITPSGLHFYEIKTYVRKQMKYEWDTKRPIQPRIG